MVAEAANLGNAKVPANISPLSKTTIARAYHESFIHAYANIMRISAGLGFLGALMSVAFIRNSAVKK